GGNEKRLESFLIGGLERPFDVVVGAHRQDRNVEPQIAGRFFGIVTLTLRKWKIRIEQKSDGGRARRQFVQKPKPLRFQRGRQYAHTGRITAGPIEAFRQAEFDGIARHAEHDWHTRSCGFRRKSRGLPAEGSKEAHRSANKLGRLLGETIVLTECPAVFDRNVFSLDKAGSAKALTECGHQIFRIFRRSRAEEPNNWNR